MAADADDDELALLYDDLPQAGRQEQTAQDSLEVEQLRREKAALQAEQAALRQQVDALQQQVASLTQLNRVLAVNISSLYKTASMELQRPRRQQEE
ncbi:hypothetical protein RI367_004530 [Sorochytrium milnesiophthora]